MLPLIAFYGFSALAIIAGLLILFTRNIMYAALCLFIILLSVSALFVLAGADFLAVTQLLVYVGGVLVLLVFGIMLTRRNWAESAEANAVKTPSQRMLVASIVTLTVLGGLIWLIFKTNFLIIQQPQSSKMPRTTLQRMGVGFMTDYVWAFELIGILLLVTLVGATYLASQQKPNK